MQQQIQKHINHWLKGKNSLFYVCVRVYMHIYIEDQIYGKSFYLPPICLSDEGSDGRDLSVVENKQICRRNPDFTWNNVPATGFPKTLQHVSYVNMTFLEWHVYITGPSEVDVLNRNNIL